METKIMKHILAKNRWELIKSRLYYSFFVDGRSAVTMLYALTMLIWGISTLIIGWGEYKNAQVFQTMSPVVLSIAVIFCSIIGLIGLITKNYLISFIFCLSILLGGSSFVYASLFNSFKSINWVNHIFETSVAVWLMFRLQYDRYKNE